MQAGESPDVSVPLGHHLRFQPNRAGRAQPWYWWIRIMGRRSPGATAAQASASLEPLFQEFNAPNDQTSAEVIGVARDATYTELRGATPPTVYVSALQQVDGNANYALRVGSQDGSVLPAIRAAVREIDPALPVLNLRTQDEQIDRLHSQERLFARLSGFFGVLALALACVGLYGLMSDAVLRRTAEIGLRMALGARPVQVRRMILGESLLLVWLGVAVGMATAWGAGRLVSSMLFGVSVTDPVTDGGAAAILAAVALLPAHRASRVDPMAAFRSV